MLLMSRDILVTVGSGQRGLEGDYNCLVFVIGEYDSGQSLLQTSALRFIDWKMSIITSEYLVIV